MKIEPGKIYYISNNYFKIINDKYLMKNHNRNRYRPSYFVFKENSILWFIPLSSKINKYKYIINKKINKYGKSKTIIIKEIAGVEVAILIQNAFPITEEYIKSMKFRYQKEVSKDLQKEIYNNFKYMMKLRAKGLNLFFTDIDSIKDKLLNNR